MSDILSFHRPPTAQRGWSQQELAEFYRVEAALVRAGLPIDSEQGLSDEAEPWFVFCRPDGAPIMHFARIGGRYVVASEVLDGPLWGEDFRGLINQIAQRHPELLPIRQGGDGTRVTVHPAALLAALVAAAAVILSSKDAGASEALGHEAGPLPGARVETTSAPSAEGTGKSEDREDHRKQFEALVVSAMIFAAFAAEEAAAGAGQDLSTDPQARSGATQDAAGEALAFSSPDDSVHREGPGAQHAAVSGGATPSGSGSAAQPGVAAAAPAPGLDPAPDALGRAAPPPGDLHAATEPNAHVVLRVAEGGPARAGGSAAPAESSPERGAGASSAAGAVETAIGPRADVDDAAPQGRSHAATSPLQDALSAATARIERVLHRDADKVTEAEPGRGPAKALEGSKASDGLKASGDGHPGRGPGKHSAEGAERSDLGHRDGDGDHGRSGRGHDGEDGPADLRGPRSSAAAEADPPRADAAPAEDRNDSGRSAANGRSEAGEHGAGKVKASAEAASASNAETRASGSDQAQAAEASGKGAAGASPSSEGNAAKIDLGDHGGAETASAYRSENRSTAADHGPAAEHPGNGNAGASPSSEGGAVKTESADHGGAASAPASRADDKSAAADHAQSAEHPGKGIDPHGAADAGDPVEQAAARSGASGDAASPHNPASEAAKAHHAAAAEPPGLKGEAPGTAMGQGSDKTVSAGHDAAGPGAASQPTAHPAGDPADVGPQKDNAALGAHAKPGQAADGAGPGPQPGAPAAHDPSVSHPVAAGQSPAKAPAASLDRDGNIVFASDAGHAAPPASNHAPGNAPVQGPAHASNHAPPDGGIHAEVGLVGVADHAGPAHHLDFHS